ncbi:MAG: carbohydrate ABC transporter permease [Candidatus Omnitrophica bacterium]|nr:carbohydrate ABC transporter permease [Candidatus Omnitrophota bacterium]MBU0880923.1 carbohydrate ABC transporter permease [Candidatus Omnitrophota bacterium]MBU0895250.1 carbohydrate ABC transporter permease [Candidatus Omnitrophota bacterium]MBU1809411.1 carbohydrate ABC transporter permease [Candidatus Omnitrophota bacterium]
MQYRDDIKKKLVSGRARTFLNKSAIYAFLIIGGVTMVIPFIWMLSTSLKPYSSVFIFNVGDIQWFPSPVYWKNYIDVWRVVPFARFYANSIFIVICVTLGQVVTSAGAAYAFSRLKFPGRDKIFFAYLATMMIPGSVTMIPVFALMRAFGWIDTYKALIIPAIFSAYGTFLLRQFFMTIPRDLEDAAKIDGCSLWGIFWRVIMPLSHTAIATLTIFVSLGNWVSFMWPLLVTNSIEKRTLPVGLAYFQELYQYAQPDWGLLMAGSLITMVPIIIIFLFNQRFFVEGIKLTGMKG